MPKSQTANSTKGGPAPQGARPPGKWRRRIFRLTVLTVVLALFGYYVLPFLVPLPPGLANAVEAGTGYTDIHGEQLRKELSEDGQRRQQWLPYDQLPQTLIDATLAAEDKRFFEHGGVDFLATGRAAWDSAKAGRTVSGASTITQQLIKISGERGSRSITTKIYEILAARRIEMTWDKERILTEYLNRLEYGNLCTGASAAAWGYFQKPAADLSTAEAAFLAGLPQAPSRLNPYKNFDGAVKRQQWILDEMKRVAMIDDQTHRSATAEKLDLRQFSGGYHAPHAVDQVIAHAGTSNSSVGGNHNRPTTIDLELQRAVETAVREELANIGPERNATNASVVVIDNATAEIRALVGSKNYFDPDSGQVNGAMAPRSPGSALKPFVYLLAFESGISPVEIIPDLPVTYSSEGGQYSPVNYDRKFHGPVTPRDALACSLNIPAVKLTNHLGGARPVIDKLTELGITTLTKPSSHYGLGLAIGGAEVRLVELAGAYSALARKGNFLPPTLTPRQSVPSGSPICREPIAYIISDMLSDNAARSRAFGRGSALKLPFRVAAKTGTSTDFRDNWTLGYTPEFTVGVWVGNFDNTSMRHVSGVTGAGPIFRSVFQHLNRTHDLTWYSQPEGLAEITIDPRTGNRVGHMNPPPSIARRELVPTGQLPPPATASDYTDSGAAILPPLYRNWIESGDNWLGATVTLDTADTLAEQQLEITRPARNATFFLDPDIPGGGRILSLRCSSPNEDQVRWHSSTLTILPDRTAKLSPGKHQIFAEDPDSGEKVSVWITVEEL